MDQATLDEWDRLATQAVEHGADVFTMVRSNARVQAAGRKPVAPGTQG